VTGHAETYILTYFDKKKLTRVPYLIWRSYYFYVSGDNQNLGTVAADSDGSFFALIVKLM